MQDLLSNHYNFMKCSPKTDFSKMVSVQERLKLKRAQIDTWSVREQLCLASAVLRSGDQNWMSVSRSLKVFGDAGRPPDWFSQKSCAVQYSNLLENVETPKRKKRTDKGEASLETPSESIARRLTEERIEELKKLLNEDKQIYAKLKDDVLKVKSGVADDKLCEMCQEIEEEKRQKIKKTEAHERWLKEREEKKIELERAWKPPVGVSSPHKRKQHQRLHCRNINNSEPSSEVECALDSPLSEPLNVDIIGEDNVHEAAVETKPSQTPTSPLLTSLLKSPSPAPTSQGSSILHSAITSHRGASPTISSLLSSAPGVPGTGNVSVAPPTTVSSSLKNLVSSAISAEQQHHQPPPHNPSPAAGAPTLSMLLELPPSLPGKPLPELPSVVKTTTISPSTVSAVVSAVPTHSCSSEKLITMRTVTTTAPSSANVKKVDSSTLSSEEVVSHLPSEFKIANSTSKDDIVMLPITSSQNSVDNSLLASNKEELIEEVLIEEVVVNEDSVITSGLLPTQITDVVVPSDQGEVKIQECKKGAELKLDQFIEVSQSTEVFPLPKEETKNEKVSDVDSTSKNSALVVNDNISAIEVKSVKEHCAIIESAQQEIITEIVNDEEAPLDIVPESEVELSSAVAEVIEITEDQETTIQTEVVGECEPCIQELENMEVIILDKMQEIDGVQIVENMKELGCEVVEVVMGDQEKVEDLKEETGDIIADAVKSEISHIDTCSIIPKSTIETISAENRSKYDDSFVVQDNLNDKNAQTIFNISSSLDAPMDVSKTFIDGYSTENINEACHDGNNKKKLNSNSLAKNVQTELQDVEDSQEKCYQGTTVSVSVCTVHSIKTEGVQNDNSNKVVQVTANSQDDADDNFSELQQITRKNDKSILTLVINESLSNKTPADLSEDIFQKKEFSANLTNINSRKSDLKGMDSANKEPKKIVRDISKSLGEHNLCESSKQTVSKTGSSDLDYFSTNVTSQDVTAVQEKLGEVYSNTEETEKHELETPETVNQAKSKEEKLLCKDPVKRDFSRLVDSFKKIVKEYVQREDRDNFKDGSGKESHIRENETDNSVNELNENESSVESNEVHPDELQEPNISKEIAKKETSALNKDSGVSKRNFLSSKKEFPFRDVSHDTGKKDLLNRDIKEDAFKKDGMKPGSSKEDKKESSKTELKKKLHREFVRSQRKSTWEGKKSEISVLESENVIKTENENFVSDEIENIKDRIFIKSSQKSEENRNKLELHQQREEKSNDSKFKTFFESDKMSPNAMVKEGKDYNKGTDIKLETMDIMDEKLERRGMLRAETPSTEDDKTNDAEPQKTFGRKRFAAVSAIDSVPNSPASTTDEEREYKSWKKSIMLLYGRLATHKFASLFLRPITDDQAPGYSGIVHRPIDLLTIKKNIETGVIRTTLEFQRDVMLMFLNSIMYNKSSHFVHKMALQMQSEGMQHIQDYLTTQMLVQVAGDAVPIRRETRTTEANKQREMLTNPSAPASQEDSENNQVYKRKRLTGSESERSIKKKRVDERNENH